MSLTINSPITGQNFVVPVKAAFRADQCANIELGWSSVLYFIAAHYQSLLFIIASCIVCVIITKFVSQAANKSRFVLFNLPLLFLVDCNLIFEQIFERARKCVVFKREYLMVLINFFQIWFNHTFDLVLQYCSLPFLPIKIN